MPFATGKHRSGILLTNIAILLVFGWVDYMLMTGGVSGKSLTVRSRKTVN